MDSSRARLLPRILSVGLVFFLFVFSITAQDDPNPDSPTPVLLGQANSNRVLAIPATTSRRVRLPKIKSQAFSAGSKVSLFVTGISLLPDEDASAFRVYAEDDKGRRYRFPVLDVQPAKGQTGIYALTVRLTDELGFWENPVFGGDVLVSVGWRGMTSKRLRLGIGGTGGNIKDDAPETVGAFVPNQTDGKKATSLSPLNAIGYIYAEDRVRFMEQATFGPSRALDARLRRIGLRAWLAEQFDAPYPSVPYPNLALMPSNVSTDCQNNIPVNCVRDFYSMYAVQNWFYKEAFYGDAQLRHRAAWALSQLWVVSGVDTQQASYMFAYHQKLGQHAFGNYRNLMTDMTVNPAMGNYLDMVRSTKNSPNENYAREILQLFSIGLFMLNQDGTLQRDAQGNPIPTYDQATVNNFTKVFTGWTLCNTGCPNSTLGAPNYKDPMIVNQNNHDVSAKTLLNYPGAVNRNIAANLNAATEMNLALDNIFNHPNVAPFVSRYLIQQMVTSDPTPAYVGRVAAVFNNNGSNARGDLKAVVRAILIDPEARGGIKTDANYGKLREPVQLATNLFRQFNVRSGDGAAGSDGYVNPQVATMGQNAFNSPTVFNYYSPEYTVPGTALNGPEFGIMTTGTAIARANFVNTFVFSRLTGGTNNTPLGTSLDLSGLQALSTLDASGNRLLDHLNFKMLHGTMSAAMKNTILTAVLATPATDPLTRARTALYLVATSSQYQVQR